MQQQPGPSAGGVIRFGVFEADLRSGELRRNGIRVKIQELPLRALKLLLSRPNQVLAREEFRQALWPDGVFVDFDHGISSAINRLRDALGDSADNPVFIETVERRGYRWIAPTQFPQLQGPVEIAPKEIEAAAPSEAQKVPQSAVPAARWGWILVFPAIALLVVAWSLRSGSRAARAGTPPASASMSSTKTASHHVPSHEAEELYLKGRYYWNKRTPDGLNKAVDYFTQAIVSDPNYAKAYVGLADSYNLLREYTPKPATEAYPRALAAARKAVELDDSCSEAHASVAFTSFFGMWDVATADREFRRAIELNPDNAAAHHWYATYLTTLGRHPESLAEIERAQALDPTSTAILADKGFLLYRSGHHDEALVLLKQMEATDPNFVSPHRYLKDLYLTDQDYPDYVAELKKEALLMQDSGELKMARAGEKGLASAGGRGMLENMLAVENKLYERKQCSPYLVAQTNAELGNKAQALRYLQMALEKHDEAMVSVAGDAAFNSLHDDPAYRDLLVRVGLPGGK